MWLGQQETSLQLDFLTRKAPVWLISASVTYPFSGQRNQSQGCCSPKNIMTFATVKQFGCLKLGTYIKTAHLSKLLCLGKAKETLGLLFFINNHIVCWGNLLQLCWLDWVQRFGPLDQQLHGDKRSPLSMWVCDNSMCCQDLWRALVPAQQSLSLPALCRTGRVRDTAVPPSPAQVSESQRTN